jgi:hypothetical protein
MRRCLTLRKFWRMLALALLASSALLLAGAGEALADVAYGPPPPPAPSVPGGFSDVVTSVTIGPAGGKIGPVWVDGLLVTLLVPAGAFSAPVQITVTAPIVRAIGDAGFPGFEAIGGVGIQVQRNGSPYRGTFLKPLKLDITSPSLTRSDLVVRWNGRRFVLDHSVDLDRQMAQISFDTDPDFAILRPTVPIRGATSAATGVPLLGEGILAGALILLGAGGLAVAVRRRGAR